MDNKRLEYVRSRKSPFGIGDAVVFAAAIVLSVVLVFTVFSREKGAGIEITCGDEVVVLPLGEDAVVRVADHVTVCIEDGFAYVSQSDCQRKICVSSGKIGRVGESIVCAQYGVVITVMGDNGLAGTVGR